MHQVFLHNNFLNSLLSIPREIPRVSKAVDQIISNPSNPGLQFHRITESQDNNFWSVRVAKDARLILHIKNDVILICHADKHDPAYEWARRRKLTGDVINKSAKIISLEGISIKEKKNPPFLLSENNHLTDIIKIDNIVKASKPLFSDNTDKEFLDNGFDQDDLTIIRSIENESELHYLENKFSQIMFDKLIALFLKEEIPTEDFETFETKNEFKTDFIELTDSESIKSALKRPWEQWLIFLSHAQNKLVKANFNGSSKVFGGAGTGKTVVALHRVKFLIENQKLDEIGLFTFSKVLTQDLKIKVDLLLGESSTNRKKIHINSLEDEATIILNSYYGERFKLIGEFTADKMLISIFNKLNLKNEFSIEFILSEYQNIIGPWNLFDYKDYKNFQRKGRGTPLSSNQRKALTNFFSIFKRELLDQNKVSIFDLYHMASEILSKSSEKYKSIVIDEAQDLGPHMLKFVRALTDKKNNDIMLCGDTGQSLYYRNHSWLHHGIDIRGRSSNLYINYRTSKEIKDLAEKLNEENNKSISTFNGFEPEVHTFKNITEEINSLLKWIKLKINEGIALHEIIVLSRDTNDLKLFSKKLKENNIPCWELDSSSNFLYNEVGLAGVRRVKGLEYRCVAIVNCNEDQFPSEKEFEKIGDIKDEEDFFIKEINLLYVAMTRARDNLYISATNPPSSYLSPLE